MGDLLQLAVVVLQWHGTVAVKGGRRCASGGGGLWFDGEEELELAWTGWRRAAGTAWMRWRRMLFGAFRWVGDAMERRSDGKQRLLLGRRRIACRWRQAEGASVSQERASKECGRNMGGWAWRAGRYDAE